MKEISKLTVLSKEDIIKELESIFGKDDSESNERCYQCVKHHDCPANDDCFCQYCMISGATWLFEDYEVGD